MVRTIVFCFCSNSTPAGPTIQTSNLPILIQCRDPFPFFAPSTASLVGTTPSYDVHGEQDAIPFSVRANQENTIDELIKQKRSVRFKIPMRIVWTWRAATCWIRWTINDIFKNHAPQRKCIHIIVKVPELGKWGSDFVFCLMLELIKKLCSTGSPTHCSKDMALPFLRRVMWSW